jgi:hypothetical protein
MVAIQQEIKRENKEISSRNPPMNLRYFSYLELSKVSDKNFKNLSKARVNFKK